jgi:phosphoglycerol geranylgeranyltransferase
LNSKIEPGKVFSSLLSASSRHGSAFLVLVDPDKTSPSQARSLARRFEEAGVDAFLVGGSQGFCGSLGALIAAMKKFSRLPVILFPGSACQISERADAILFLSLLSSRNAEYLIGEHVKAAPLLHRMSIEVIPTAYLLVESGTLTSVQFVTQSLPIPREKTDVAVAHALAGKYLGMKLVYLEAGSGAGAPVPAEMVRAVSLATELPVAVGGGVRTPEEAGRLARSGASFVVVGNALEATGELSFLKELSEAIHFRG